MRLLPLLDAFGRLGPSAPAAAIVLGALVPPLGALGHAALIPSVALLLFASVAVAEPGRLEWRELPPVLALAAANLLLAPVIVHAIAEPLGLERHGGWLVLMAASPVAGGAVLLAGLLGLPVRALLLAQLLCFFLVPVTAPFVAAVLLGASVVDPSALLVRVALIVGLPALLALAARRGLGERRLVAERGRFRALGLLALAGVGLAAGHRLPGILADGELMSVAVPGVILVVAVGAALGWLAGAGSGLAPVFALGGGVRNVSMIWGATAGIASAEGSAILQLASVWVVASPAVIAFALARWRVRQLAAAATRGWRQGAR